MNTKQECNIGSPISDTNNKVLEEIKLLTLNRERNHNDLKHQVMENATSISDMTERLQGHRELEARITNMEEEMSSLKQMCSLLPKENDELQNRKTELEGSNIENSVLFSGIAKGVWETFTDCRQKVLDALAKTVRNKSPNEADKSVQNIALSHVKRVGIFSKNTTRPISVKFVNQSDKNYLMEHKTSSQKEFIWKMNLCIKYNGKEMY